MPLQLAERKFWNLVANVMLIFLTAIDILYSVMGSLQELQRLLRSKEETIKKLEQELNARDELIEQMKSQLDKYQSIIPSSLTNSLTNGYAPRKQRAQGISAAPAEVKNLSLQQPKKYSKPDRLVFNLYLFYKYIIL